VRCRQLDILLNKHSREASLRDTTGLPRLQQGALAVAHLPECALIIRLAMAVDFLSARFGRNSLRRSICKKRTSTAARANTNDRHLIFLCRSTTTNEKGARARSASIHWGRRTAQSRPHAVATMRTDHCKPRHPRLRGSSTRKCRPCDRKPPPSCGQRRFVSIKGDRRPPLSCPCPLTLPLCCPSH